MNLFGFLGYGGLLFCAFALHLNTHGNIFFLYLKALIIVYSVEISPSENFLQGGKPLSLSVQSAGHTLHVLTEGQLHGIY